MVTDSHEEVKLTHGPRYGFAGPELTRVELPMPGLDAPLRVAHLTDVHFGAVTPISLQRQAVAQVNAEKPDLVLLTGDFICRGRSYLDRISEVLGQLEGRKLAVLGNHDWWTDGPEVRRQLELGGVEVLTNTWTRVGELALVGLDDWGTDHHDVHAAMRGVSGPVLAMSHNPEAAPELWASGAGLVLSGHTHGGQFHVEKWTPELWRSLLKVRYLSGIYEHEGRRVYVNPGVGSSVVPWRYGRPAMRTVSILELTPAPRLRTRAGGMG